MGGLRRLTQRVVRLADGARWDLVSGFGGVVLLIGALLVVIVYVPLLAVDPHGLTADQLRTHQDNLRGHILQGLGGLALLGTLYFSARTLGLNRRGQLTDRFGKAIEQLGSDSVAVRLGGIYALEQIAFDSAELHWPIMEVLTAYLREHAPVRQDAADEADAADRQLPADHQAIATVIGRRRHQQDPKGSRLNLDRTDLPHVDWVGAHLENALLRWAHVSGTLAEARLAGAWLYESHMQGTNFWRADLTAVMLNDAHLEEAILEQARLEEADIRGLHLEGAWLGGASGLTPAKLKLAADPERARLSLEQAGWLGLTPEPPPGDPDAGSDTTSTADPDPR
jgi:Pentapeptide repeats (8 copies)